ncbi:MAG: polysaccharide deacetylase family protein [Dethiobacteria bacterium]|nr:polysaccharide deacetylase family protein [Bacillota bacterium]
MAKGKGRRGQLILLVTILVPLLFAAGYAITNSATGERLRQWFGIEEIKISPSNEDRPETSRKPVHEYPGEKTGEEEPDRKPFAPPPGNEEPPDQETGEEIPDTTPVIYVGQVLTIPVTSEGDDSVSQVITDGTISSGSKQIALTFDSGWEYKETIPLLNVLDQYGVKATFFPRALWLKDHPGLGREIARRGHTFGNHSLTHPHLTQMSAAAIREEIRQSTQLIWNISGTRPYLFRPPYGEYNNQLLTILAEEGYPYTIMWTIDTLDWAAGETMTVGGQPTYIDVDFIVNRALKNASDGGIVLMHIGGPDTVKALPRIIEGLQQRGYSFTTVDRMLPPPYPSGQVTYSVKSGDTLYRIARLYGISVQQIIDANNL